MPTLKIVTTLTFPVASEASPVAAPPFEFELVYTQKNVDDVVFGGVTTDADLMGRITDAKACFVQCLAGAGDLKVNGSTPTIPLKAGTGFWAFANPDGGLTDLTVSTADAASFRLYMFS